MPPAFSDRRNTHALTARARTHTQTVDRQQHRTDCANRKEYRVSRVSQQKGVDDNSEVRHVFIARRLGRGLGSCEAQMERHTACAGRRNGSSRWLYVVVRPRCRLQRRHEPDNHVERIAAPVSPPSTTRRDAANSASELDDGERSCDMSIAPVCPLVRATTLLPTTDRADRASLPLQHKTVAVVHCPHTHTYGICVAELWERDRDPNAALLQRHAIYKASNSADGDVTAKWRALLMSNCFGRQCMMRGRVPADGTRMPRRCRG